MISIFGDILSCPELREWLKKKLHVLFTYAHSFICDISHQIQRQLHAIVSSLFEKISCPSFSWFSSVDIFLVFKMTNETCHLKFAFKFVVFYCVLKNIEKYQLIKSPICRNHYFSLAIGNVINNDFILSLFDVRQKRIKYLLYLNLGWILKPLFGNVYISFFNFHALDLTWIKEMHNMSWLFYAIEQFDHSCSVRISLAQPVQNCLRTRNNTVKRSHLLMWEVILDGTLIQVIAELLLVFY